MYCVSLRGASHSRPIEIAYGLPIRTCRDQLLRTILSFPQIVNDADRHAIIGLFHEDPFLTC